MSDDQKVEIQDDEPPHLAPDAKEQRPVHPAAKGIPGTLTKWAQDGFSYQTKNGPQTTRYDNINVKVVHPELGICFIQSSPFDRRFNTSFEAQSGSSAEKFRKSMGVLGYTNSQLREWVGDGREVLVDIHNSSRPDKNNLDDDGRPVRVVEAILAGIRTPDTE